METSYNGWPAFHSEDRKARGVVPLVVHNGEFVGGILGGDVHDVHEYFWRQFHERVEPLVNPGCWGHSYRPNRNDPSELSCHSSATASDGNAPQHPNGIEASANFTDAQIREVHQILDEVPELAEVLHWGGDWHRSRGLTPDPMHIEIHDTDKAKLRRVADRIRKLNAANQEALNMDHLDTAIARLETATRDAGLALNEIKKISRPRVRVQAQLEIAALWSSVLVLRGIRGRLSKLATKK
jgi:hypothetical protein